LLLNRASESTQIPGRFAFWQSDKLVAMPNGIPRYCRAIVKKKQAKEGLNKI